MKINQIISELKKHSLPEEKYGMEKFGIQFKKSFGVKIPIIRALGKKIKTNHQLALKLWDLGYRETKLLAAIIADVHQMDNKTVEKWLKDFEAWEDVDQTCINLFWKLPNPYQKAIEWSRRKPEFEKRSGFALMAVLAWKDKTAKDKQFANFFRIIKEQSTDGRNFVKKAVNWALRQIGKRNLNLRKEAITIAEEIEKIEDKTAKWIARDALRELRRSFPD